MVTTTSFQVMGGENDGLACTYLSHQDWVSLDPFNEITSAWPFQCLIICIMNGWTRLRLQFIIHNHRHTLTFESQVVTISGSCPLCFIPRLSEFGMIQAIHISLTLPMSHYMYNEWLDKVDIGMWFIKWSLLPLFESWVEKKMDWPAPTCHTKIEWVWTHSIKSHQLDPSNVSSYV